MYMQKRFVHIIRKEETMGFSSLEKAVMYAIDNKIFNWKKYYEKVLIR